MDATYKLVSKLISEMSGTFNNTGKLKEALSNSTNVVKTEETDEFANQLTQLNNSHRNHNPDDNSREAPSVSVGTSNKSTTLQLIREDELKTEHSIICDKVVVNNNEKSLHNDLTTDGIKDTLPCFGNHLIYLLHQLPKEESFELQHKFLSETMCRLINFQRNRSLSLREKRKRKNNTVYNGFQKSTECSRVNVLSYRDNPASGCLVNGGQMSKPVVPPKKMNVKGRDPSMNGTGPHGEAEITTKEKQESRNKETATNKNTWGW